MQTSEQIYDTLVRNYDRSHERWLRHAGGEAQCAFEGAVTALLHPGLKVLDAACGTGTVARRLMATMDNNIDLALLDASSSMLSKCADIPARRTLGRLEHLPFSRNRFDLATCAWGLETVSDPMRALSELIRVIKPRGHLGLVFCADRPCRSALGFGLARRIKSKGLGQFLDPDVICEHSYSVGARDVRQLHSHGPAAALLIQV